MYLYFGTFIANRKMYHACVLANDMTELEEVLRAEVHHTPESLKFQLVKVHKSVADETPFPVSLELFNRTPERIPHFVLLDSKNNGFVLNYSVMSRAVSFTPSITHALQVTSANVNRIQYELHQLGVDTTVFQYSADD